MQTLDVPMQSRDQADSEYLSHVGWTVWAVFIGNKQTNSLITSHTDKHSTLYISTARFSSAVGKVRDLSLLTAANRRLKCN